MTITTNSKKNFFNKFFDLDNWDISVYMENKNYLNKLDKLFLVFFTLILYLIFTDNSDLKRTVVVISIFTILILIPFTINRKKKIKEKRRKGYDKVAGKRKFQENNKEEGKTILKLGVLRTQKMQVQEEIARDQAEELLGSIGRTNGERDTRSKDEKTILEWMNLEIEDKNKPQVFIKKISQNFS